MGSLKLNDEQKRLVEDNVRLVEHMAKLTGYNEDDNIQWGYYGLCQAAARYNPSKGYKFTTYACNYIRGWICGTYLDNKYSKNIYSGKVVLSEEVENFAGTYECSLEDKCVIEDIVSHSQELKKLCTLLVQGYKRSEIMKIMNISGSRLDLLLKVLREELSNAGYCKR